ncbi:keratin, type I cytoskeletal 9 isoform X2 [Oncorhynchus tshawytscha]|uniref:keratin, type I cytoskeletal 9 isoform X2 n=1 Tax=Oncorhynchus tshawytscha TaxID=74940 RepID=UPI000D0A7E34|nr:keratin, type I cytoskeletal 9 isoform X2 [Oncorhynchus tshawytscha]
MQQGYNPRPSYGAPPQKRFRNANGGANNRRKQPNFSADIVFTTKAGNVQTIPSLTKQLKGITGETVIGLQYVWEYRSPSKSVPPHYQCKLCKKVSRLQTDMLAHIKGWKHSFRYMKQNHSAKMPFKEDAATKDHEVRKKVKEAAAELEKAEGRGQLKVILKEPSEVQAFAGLRSAIPNMGPPGGMGGPGGMGARGPKPGGRFAEPLFPGEFPLQGGGLNYPVGGMGSYSDPLPRSTAFQKRDMSFRGYPDNTGGQRLGGSADGFGLGGGRDGSFGQEGLLGESPGSRYPDEFRGGQMGSGSGHGLMGAVPETSSLPTTLLKYLDNFQIENEGDAQIVLKVTQKLTDVLMDYRLRSVSSGPSMKSGLSLGSMSYSDSPRMSSSSDRFSGNLSGPSRY